MINTAKEKAKELVDKYLNAPFNCTNCDMPFCDIRCTRLNNYEAKQCALIAVNNIILANPHSNPFNTNVYSTMDYWHKVKEELEKL